MKEKKTIILVVVLMLLVGVYVWYSQEIKKETKPKIDISKLDERLVLKGKLMRAVRLYRKDKGNIPRSLNELKGEYLDQATIQKAAESKIAYVYLDANSYRIVIGKAGPVKLAAKGSNTKGKVATTSSTAASTTKELVTTETGWKYDPTGKPDPFKSFILATAAQEEVAPKVVRHQLTPLQKMPMSEIQAGLKAIIWGQLGNKALVEDATGKGYVVQEGTYVGQNDGIVKKIYQDRIVVEEYRRDPGKGRLEPNEVVLKLKKVEAEE